MMNRYTSDLAIPFIFGVVLAIALWFAIDVAFKDLEVHRQDSTVVELISE